MTINSFPDNAVLPSTVMDNGPVVAPAGTVVIICIDVAEVTIAGVPLNLTVLSAGTVLKSCP